jgi:hypothetical protein
MFWYSVPRKNWQPCPPHLQHREDQIFVQIPPVKKTDASLQHIQLLIRPPARPRAFPHGENKLQPFLGAKGDQVIRNSFGCCRIVQNSDLSVAVDIHTHM